MSEVKVTIEWNGNTAGLHPDPMKVQITAQADLNEVIRAVWKAMGVVEEKKTPKCKDDEFIHIEQDGGKVKVGFPTWHEALDRIVVDCTGADHD